MVFLGVFIETNSQTIVLLDVFIKSVVFLGVFIESSYIAGSTPAGPKYLAGVGQGIENKPLAKGG